MSNCLCIRSCDLWITCRSQYCVYTLWRASTLDILGLDFFFSFLPGVSTLGCLPNISDKWPMSCLSGVEPKKIWAQHDESHFSSWLWLSIANTAVDSIVNISAALRLLWFQSLVVEMISKICFMWYFVACLMLWRHALYCVETLIGLAETILRTSKELILRPARSWGTPTRK